MLARFAHVASGPTIVDTTNTTRMFKTAEFAAAYAHCRFMSGKTLMSITELWSKSKDRMTADCIGFHPAKEQFFTETGRQHLNLWNPLIWPRSPAVLAQPFFDHLVYLIPDERDRESFIDWMAHAIQQPAVRPHFHFLLIA